MRVYQYWPNRYSPLLVALLLVACFTYGVVSEALSLRSALLGGPVFILPLLALTPRSIRGGAEGTESELIVRGWLWTRRIPRAAISDVTQDFVVWTAPSGKVRVTHLTMFWNGARTPRPFYEHNVRAITQIRAWSVQRAPT